MRSADCDGIDAKASARPEAKLRAFSKTAAFIKTEYVYVRVWRWKAREPTPQVFAASDVPKRKKNPAVSGPSRLRGDEVNQRTARAESIQVRGKTRARARRWPPWA